MTVSPSAALQAERVAILYRRIVLLIGGQILGSVLGQALAAGAEPGDGALLAAVDRIFE